jgi:hypothetical protein
MSIFLFDVHQGITKYPLLETVVYHNLHGSSKATTAAAIRQNQPAQPLLLQSHCDGTPDVTP